MVRFRFILGLLAALGLGLYTYIHASNLNTWADDQRIVKITFKAACDLSNYKCNFPLPTLRRSPILGDQNIRGMYTCDAPILWVDPSLNGTQLWLTTFHENVHYIQCMNGTIKPGYGSTMSRCVAEREAWSLVNIYVDELRAPQRYKRSLETWLSLYNCSPTKRFMRIHWSSHI